MSLRSLTSRTSASQAADFCFIRGQHRLENPIPFSFTFLHTQFPTTPFDSVVSTLPGGGGYGFPTHIHSESYERATQ